MIFSIMTEHFGIHSSSRKNRFLKIGLPEINNSAAIFLYLSFPAIQGWTTGDYKQ